MAFKLVRGVGSDINEAATDMYASGVVWSGGVAVFDHSNPYVSAGSTSETSTTLVGISLDYKQGKSDTQTRVIPFLPGQLWEVDCTNTPTTAMLHIRHNLTDAVTLANTSYDISSASGIFVTYGISGATGDKKMLGEFIPRNATVASPGTGTTVFP